MGLSKKFRVESLGLRVERLGFLVLGFCLRDWLRISGLASSFGSRVLLRVSSFGFGFGFRVRVSGFRFRVWLRVSGFRVHRPQARVHVVSGFSLLVGGADEVFKSTCRWGRRLSIYLSIYPSIYISIYLSNVEEYLSVGQTESKASSLSTRQLMQ